MGKISWTNSSGGSWTVGSNWSNGNVPGPNDNVTIAIAPGMGLSGYTVDLATDVVVKSLALDQAAATLQVGDGQGDGDGTLTTHLKLQAGTLDLNNGTLSGLVTDTGGVFQVDYSGYGIAYGTLSDVTWQGDLQPILNPERYQGTLSVVGGLTLTGAGGRGPGTLTLTQAGLGMNFLDTQTLDNATVYFGGASDYGYYVPFLSNSTDGNAPADLTFGSHLLLDASSSGYIYDDGQITNNGTISTTGTTTLDFFAYSYDTGTFTNAGAMEINADAYVSVDLEAFTNTGSVTVAAGGTLDLDFAGYPAMSFENTGSFLDDGVLQMDGTITTAQVQGWDITYGSSGTLLLSSNSVLDNSGTDLVLGGGGIAANFAVGGTIQGGTVTENGGNLVADGGTLSGVTLDGPLSLSGSYSSLTIVGSLQADPGTTLSITGYDATLTFFGETLDEVTIVMGSAGGDTLASNSQGTLTLDATVQVDVNAGSADFGGYEYDSTIINEGGVAVSNDATGYFGTDQTYFVNDGSMTATGGSTLYLDSGFTNDGAVSVQDSTLLLVDRI